jgi:hypothetical protein
VAEMTKEFKMMEGSVGASRFLRYVECIAKDIRSVMNENILGQFL